MALKRQGALAWLIKKLGLGKVSIWNNLAYFKVNKQEDIIILINIFDKFPLNTTKRLDYLDWKKALGLYIEKLDYYVSLILEIKSGMNTKRLSSLSYFEDISITKYWLLGFIEGEGCFNVEKTLIAKFRLGQVSKKKYYCPSPPPRGGGSL